MNSIRRFDMYHLERLRNILDENPVRRRIRNRKNYFEDLAEDEFFKRFRLSKETVLFVLEEIEDQLIYTHNRNNSLSPMNQLLLTLGIFATGSHQMAIADFIQCDASTVCRIVQKVSVALANLYKKHIYMPKTAVETADAQTRFYEVNQFPRVLGVVGGTHVRISSPGGDNAETFRNSKGYFSIKVQVVVNASYEFTDVVARWPGSVDDLHILNHSRINYKFEEGHFGNGLLLGDSGYSNNLYMLTPILNPQNRAEEMYNESHKNTRVIVEDTIGLWKRRFPILAYGCKYKLKNILPIVIATAVLYNIARRRGEAEPPMENDLQVAIANGQIPTNQEEEQNNDTRQLLIDKHFSTFED